MGFLKSLFGGGGFGVDELARRLGMAVDEIRSLEPAYRLIEIPKRSGGLRRIHEPEAKLKALQRRLLRRVLARLAAHPAAMGFERGLSIVTNALPHVRRAVVVRMDIEDFFASTKAGCISEYFRAIGWNKEASALLARLTTWENGLPAGAPTSPRLSNLVNYKLDARLLALATKLGSVYTRYADDMTFSFAEDRRDVIQGLIRCVKTILDEEGYVLHQKKKLRILRRHQRQTVTGVVVNERPALPHSTRRWLRAVEHRAATRGRASLTTRQLEGWRALRRMVEGRSTP